MTTPGTVSIEHVTELLRKLADRGVGGFLTSAEIKILHGEFRQRGELIVHLNGEVHSLIARLQAEERPT